MMISGYKLAVALYAFTMLLPSFFSNAVFNLCENLFALSVFLILFMKRYKPSKIVCAFGGYIIILLLSSMLNQTSAVNVHLLVSNMKLVLFFASIDWFSQYNKDGAFKVLWWIIAAISIINFGSLILYPEGIRNITYTWNEWGASDEIRQWIVGNKNSQALWYIAFLLLTYYLIDTRYVDSRLFKKVLAVCVSAISFYSVFTVGSSTGMVSVAFVAVAVVICSFASQPPSVYLDSKWILVVYAVVMSLLLLGNTSIFEPIVSGIFGKDLTFSNRTYVWARSLMLIIQKPLIGYGYMDNDTMRDLFGSLSYTSAHNQILNSLLQGGIVLTLTLIAGFWWLLNNINHAERRVKIVCFFGVCAILIEMLFEAVLAEPIAWTVIFIINILTDRDELESENLQIEQGE